MPKGFQKGHNGFKPKGALSQKTKDWDELGLMHQQGGAAKAKKILEAYGDLAFDDDGELNIKFADKFMDHYLNTLEYFKSKQSRVETSIKLDNTVSSLIFEDAKEDTD